jgi:transcriptional regulator with XRE-family HTH domain
MTTLGDRIQYIRKDRLGLTQDDMAERLGVSAGNTISNYEKNIRQPDIDALIKIAELGKVSLDWLLTGKKNTAPASDSRRKYVSEDEVNYNPVPAIREYPVVSQIPAGQGSIKMLEHPEWKEIDFDPRKYFWLKVDEEYGFSMRPFLRPKEMVLCAYETKKFFDEDMVAVLWDKTKGAVKILNLNHNMKDIVVLDSLNPSERTITLKKSQVTAMYKVVLVAKI